jgi:zinc transport system substrate-binding protein
VFKLSPSGLSTAVATTLATSLGTALLSGCGSTPLAGGEGHTVAAGFYPFAYVAQRVAGEHASVTNLTSAGVEPHDLELTPQQVAGIAEADVVVFEQGFQPAVDDAVEENAEGTLVEVRPAASTPAGAEELAADPHIWQNPTTLVPVARRVADALAETDPAHAADYRRNADALTRQLQALDRTFREGLADCRLRTFVTSHAAFGHLAHRYGLRMVPIAGVSPEAEPNPGRLADLQQLVEDEGVTTVFTETLASPALARTLAAEVGVRTAVLDPIEGLTQATADETYFSLMRANLAALRKANGCA